MRWGYRPYLENNAGLSDGCNSVGGSTAGVVWPDVWTALTTDGGSIDFHTPAQDGVLAIRPAGTTYADITSGMDMLNDNGKVLSHSHEGGSQTCYNAHSCTFGQEHS